MDAVLLSAGANDSTPDEAKITAATAADEMKPFIVGGVQLFVEIVDAMRLH